MGIRAPDSAWSCKVVRKSYEAVLKGRKEGKTYLSVTSADFESEKCARTLIVGELGELGEGGREPARKTSDWFDT